MSDPAFPSRAAVKSTFLALIAGRTSREEAAAWAITWYGRDDDLELDMAVWEGLSSLALAASATGPAQYTYGPDDFQDWLQEFTTACSNEASPG